MLWMKVQTAWIQLIYPFLLEVYAGPLCHWRDLGCSCHVKACNTVEAVEKSASKKWTATGNGEPTKTPPPSSCPTSKQHWHLNVFFCQVRHTHPAPWSLKFYLSVMCWPWLPGDPEIKIQPWVKYNKQKKTQTTRNKKRTENGKQNKQEKIVFNN